MIPHKDDNSFWAKFRFGIWATCTTRFIGTREQVKNVPRFVVDGCTAWLSEPYSHTGSSCDPIWTEDMLKSVVQRADSSGLQCAFHSIGDKMIETVINIIGNVGSREWRHRIEHLELTSARDAAMLGAVPSTSPTCSFRSSDS